MELQKMNTGMDLEKLRDAVRASGLGHISHGDMEANVSILCFGDDCVACTSSCAVACTNGNLW